MLRGFGLFQKAPVEIVDQIAGAPIELRGDGGHVGRSERRDHQASQRRRQIGDHHAHISGFRFFEARKKNQRSQRHQNPRPRPDGVVRDVEPERRQQRMPLVFGAEHALRDVASAAGLGSGIPGGPPVERNVDQERDQRHPRGIEVRHEVEHRTLAAARASSSEQLVLSSGRCRPRRALRRQASAITMPILTTNWNMSVTSTPHRPESVEMKDVSAIMPMTIASACTGVTPRTSVRMSTIALLTQPRIDAVDRDCQIERPEAAQESRRLAGVADF